MQKEMKFTKYASFYDLLYLDKDYQKEINFINNLLQKFSKSNTQIILDAGCGTGLHAIELKKLGYDVAGSDISAEMVTIARANASIKGLEIDFYEESFQNIDRIEKKYDAILTMFSSINYLVLKKDLDKFFKNIHAMLNKNGVFIFDFWNGDSVIKNYSPTRKKTGSKGNQRIERVSQTKINQKIQSVDLRFDFKIFENEKKVDDFSEFHKLRYFFQEELKSILNDNDLELIFSCPFMELNNQIDEDTWNVTFVCKKNN